MKKIFIDGSYGTAGLSLKDKLVSLCQQYPNQLKLLTLSRENYKNEQVRYAMIRKADIAVLCLPEEVSIKTAQDLKECSTILIDASSAHRLDSEWIYGWLELSKKQPQLIKEGKRISNPGCFASGAVALLKPLSNYLNSEYPLQITGVTGYSAGGLKSIKKQEKNPLSCRVTSLSSIHFHVPEIKKYSEIENEIAFMPMVGNFKQGQMVEITIFQSMLKDLHLSDVLSLFKSFYKDLSYYTVQENKQSFLTPELMGGRDDVEIYINQPENAPYIQLFALYDNLGKGASGSIIQIIQQLI